MNDIGKYFILIGGLIVFIGLLLYLFGNKLSWIGHLPGDIRIEKENFRFYMPITTMIVFSIVISGLIWLIKKFIN